MTTNTTREQFLSSIAAETGGLWGDGTRMDAAAIAEAAEVPALYDLDADDLDAAAAGDAGAILRLRQAFGLCAF